MWEVVAQMMRGLVICGLIVFVLLDTASTWEISWIQGLMSVMQSVEQKNVGRTSAQG